MKRGVLLLVVLFSHATARTVYEWNDDNIAVQGGLGFVGGREPANSSLVRSADTLALGDLIRPYLQNFQFTEALV